MPEKLATALIIVFCALSLAAFAEELPQIEMPDVVISGVERATIIKADRLQFGKNEVQVNLAQGLLTNRPEIQSQSIKIFPKRPSHKDISQDNRVVLEAGGGSFGNFNGSVIGNFPLAYINLDTKTKLDIPPQRIQAGQDFLGTSEIAFIHHAPGQSQLHYKLGFSATQFTLNDVAHSERNWADFFGDVHLSPVFTPIGSFAVGFHYNSWSNEGIGSFDGDIYSCYFRQYTDLGTWQISSEYNGFWEQLPTDYQELGINAGRLSIIFKSFETLRVSAGLSSYRGYSHTFGVQDGVDAAVGLSWNPGRSTLVKLSWEPGYEVFSARQNGQIYPMITDNTWGAISEDYARLKFSMAQNLSAGSKVYLRGLYADSPHYPFPLQEFNDVWSMATSRLNLLEAEVGWDYQIIHPLVLNISGGMRQADAANPNINQTAPQLAPYFADVSIQWLAESFWSEVNFHWEDGFPVALLDDRTTPSHWESELTVGYTFGRKMQAFVTTSNLVNSPFEAIPGYDSAPLSIRAGVVYGINSSSWNWRNTLKNLANI